MKRYIWMMSLLLAFSACSFFTGCNPAPEPPTPVYYNEFGAVGDGITNDFAAIAATHKVANEQGRPVRANAGAVYYIGYTEETIEIKTDTDWGDAKFIIDDTTIASGSATWIFRVTASKDSYNLSKDERQALGKIQKGQSSIPLSLEADSLLDIRNNNVKLYIRRGQNANSGADQQEVLIVDKNGNIDDNSPVLWNYDTLTSVTVYPIDQTTLTVKGGHFTTIANRLFSNGSYMRRGIHITRSNTVLDGIRHDIVGEGEDISATSPQQTAPYSGFLFPENCANVTVQNTVLTGHRGYYRPDEPNNRRGSYDMQAVRTVNLKVLNCSQTNDITDSTFWGIFASNYTKNVLFDGVSFSRFDAHQGVYNTAIKNSELGWQCVSIIGSGKLLLENVVVKGSDNFIYFREDYGSTWEGDVEIINCSFIPEIPENKSVYGYNVFYVSNNGGHDFGYPCYMPETIIIEGLSIDDSLIRSDTAPILFSQFNASYTGNETNPYYTTKTLYMSELTVKSGTSYTIPNAYLSEHMEIINF